jgi:hypothetical protein
MATIIIAKNQTAGDLPLRFLSAPDAKIPASGQVTLTDSNTVAEIQESFQLFDDYITNDDVLLNLNGVDLTKAQSLWVRESVTPKYKNDAVTAPTNNEDKDDGYSKGSVWIDTVNTKSYICVDDASGAAIWRIAGDTDTSIGERSGVDISFFTSATPYVESNSTTPKVVVIGIFPGTDSMYPSKFKAITGRGGTSGSSKLDIWDLTNGNPVGELTWTGVGPQLIQTDTLTNLPPLNAMFQFRLYKADSGSSKSLLYYLSLR